LDVLREFHSHFSISKEREVWLRASENFVKKDGQDGNLKNRALDISNMLRNLEIENVFSVGVGGGGFGVSNKKEST